MPPLTLELIQKLPKTDLHVHLDGSLRLETILDLAREQHVALPADTPEGLRARVGVRILALAASVWLNHQLGRPTRSLVAFVA